MKFLFDRVMIVGVGQIGSSIGMALMKKKLAREVIGLGRSTKNLQEAQKRGAIQKYVTLGATVLSRCGSLKDASENDLIILATPVQSISDYLKMLSARVLVMDVGSTKGGILKIANQRKLRFVGAHPMAGTEKSGVQGGNPDLFQDRFCFLSPSHYCKKSDQKRIQELWKKLGCQFAVIEPGLHDRMVGTTSHLPHVVAYSLMSAVMRMSLSVNQLKEFKDYFASLKGMTRIAASSPEMWHDIFLDNREYLLMATDLFEEELKKIRHFILKKDSQGLLQALRRSQKSRFQIFGHPQ
ncbi:MAG: prephenate dehydrogenase [Deltaproteobacteria bacterium]|nr:prephenate dehydrogenase [Deltaproteobacteria bacterium]